MILQVDPSLNKNDKINKKKLESKKDLNTYLKHCCIQRHYSFQIKKCGSDTCNLCKPLRMSKEIFSKLHCLPDPVPGEDGHYKKFDEVFGTDTTESHRPSLSRTPKRKKTLPFVASLQHVRNVDLMLQCDECGMWRFTI